MKHLKFKASLLITMLLMFTFILLAGSSQANSGGWDKYTWRQYKIKFEIPSEFEVKENSANQFAASDDIMTFEIYPWKDANVEARDVAIQAVKDLNIEFKGSEAIVKDIKLNGFNGYRIEGNGTQKNKALHFTVLGLIDPKSSTNFAAYILYWTGTRDDNDYSAISNDIIESISKMQR